MKKIFLLVVFFLNILNAIDAELDIVRNSGIIPTISVVATKNTHEEPLLLEIKKMIEKDLEVSGHFRVLKSDFIHNSIQEKFDFPQINKMKSNLFLFIEIKKMSENNTFLVEMVLYNDEIKELKRKKYQFSERRKFPFLAHKITIDINNTLKAPSIAWMEKMIIFSRYLNTKKSEIIVADYTLTYQTVVVSGGLNIFPKWANKEQTSFYYTAYDLLYPTLMKRDLYSKKTEKIIHSDGMVVCSDVSNDGNKLVLTMAPNGQPDIYVYDTKEKKQLKVTNYLGIDVGGNFLENESKIVFVSDRLGRPNIFLTNLNDKSIERLVFHGTNNSQATTFNDNIVFSSRESSLEFGNNKFNLYQISTQNGALKRLTDRGINQFPKFSVDGETLLFIQNNTNVSNLGIARLHYGKSFFFPINKGKIQSIDW